jgi:hypothetical protein
MRTLPITRPADAPGGHEFMNRHLHTPRAEREKAFTAEILSGNVPPLHTRLAEVTFNESGHEATLFVCPDYLSIGSDTDFVRTPLDPHSAQAIADAFDCLLPTKKMVDLIWKNATVKLAPQPWGPPYDSSMMSTERYIAHNDRVEAQWDKAGYGIGNLVAGHKKDVVITNVLANNPTRVAIYGWHQLDGKAIQGPGVQAKAHEDTYADYAHGIRLISKTMLLDGAEVAVTDVLADKALCSLLSEEGPVLKARYF